MVDPELHAPRVSNGTDVPLSLFVEQEGGLVPLSTIPSGVIVQLRIYESQCTREPLVAVAPDGREVGRRVDPICPDETWLIKNER
jgi:hypothetical protein